MYDTPLWYVQRTWGRQRQEQVGCAKRKRSEEADADADVEDHEAQSGFQTNPTFLHEMIVGKPRPKSRQATRRFVESILHHISRIQKHVQPNYRHPPLPTNPRQHSHSSSPHTSGSKAQPAPPTYTCRERSSARIAQFYNAYSSTPISALKSHAWIL